MIYFVLYAFVNGQVFQKVSVISTIRSKLVEILDEMLVELFENVREQTNDDGMRIVENLFAPLYLE